MWNEQLSLDEQVALNLGDADWRENAPLSASGCYRRNTFEVEKPMRVEREPQIDKWKNAPYR